ncbi:hypothetical protein EO95_15535 [Methanosarcina sp. 1.H.T.1A.1]|uniref:hypothetical protein n=1 Tax=Methanosarcina sp. 1.H.T.1A.1 TaxID=1483602 RepID=UPI0006213836|nr:hypothetical protein [Methanosarcina sp. 1.H.T.1A.1]KKH95329.1 hypothetical protein EO95_15535 [Methanosarcina sp. 1.H.T.1A.1]
MLNSYFQLRSSFLREFLKGYDHVFEFVFGLRALNDCEAGGFSKKKEDLKTRIQAIYDLLHTKDERIGKLKDMHMPDKT